MRTRAPSRQLAAMSSRPSPFTSPTATDSGVLQPESLQPGKKKGPSLRPTVIRFELSSATTKSRSPSPSMSPTASANGADELPKPIPRDVGKLPAPLFLSTFTVLPKKQATTTSRSPSPSMSARTTAWGASQAGVRTGAARTPPVLRRTAMSSVPSSATTTSTSPSPSMSPAATSLTLVPAA